MKLITLLIASFFIGGCSTSAKKPAVGAPAPLFETKTHEGSSFNLQDRKGKWTILYFYPKAETPGCTKQACAFRDSIKQVRALNADVFGVSADSVEAVAKFHKKENLNFTLLSDPELKVIEAYGAKGTVLPLAKRWTYVIDPQLVIRHVDEDVDPTLDAERTANVIKGLQAKAP
ncbi:MAG TPA: peroxiredoxin [Bdellovibrionales bacterium]|nr:peroxiredoxin [Bdellovibrionales bacterium]